MSSLFAPDNIFEPPTELHELLTRPIKTLIRFLDYGFSLLHSSPKPGSPPIRVVCMSDTHTLRAAHVPDGDLLIHAGDMGNDGTPAELQAQIDWLDHLPHKYKVVIAGNHDTYLDPRSRKTLSQQNQQATIKWRSVRYLQHSSTTLHFGGGRRELKLYGAPQIPACGGSNFAFQYPRGHDAWSETVPDDTDILITHTPPKYHLDLPVALGCEHLLKEVWRVRPTLHIFGHVHAGKMDTMGWLKGGKEVVQWSKGQARLERGMTRPNGFIRAVLDPWSWIDVAKVLYHGISEVLWDRIWGGYSERTIMVNAALMYNNTGRLGNEPMVIDI